MSLLNDNPALKLYALVSALVGVHVILLALWTGTVRTMRKQWVNPEDAKLNKGEVSEQDHPDVQRVKRAHMNALENALPFLAIGLVYALTAPSKVGAQAYFFTFLGARLLHTIFYLWGKQPFRTLMFAVGVLANLGMAVHVVRAVM
ncbi:MAG: MAPEG family protein [Polyangiaceae bacterium]